MAKSVKDVLKEEYSRLKEAIEKIISPKKQQPLPQLILQPVRNRQAGKKMRGNLR